MARIFCDWCGEDMGEGSRYPGELNSCGARECDREVRDMERGAREERMLDAAADDYGRY